MKIRTEKKLNFHLKYNHQWMEILCCRCVEDIKGNKWRWKIATFDWYLFPDCTASSSWRSKIIVTIIVNAFFWQLRSFGYENVFGKYFEAIGHYQNPSGFCFLVQIRAFVISTSMGLTNLNMKEKTKWSLVSVVKKTSSYKWPIPWKLWAMQSNSCLWRSLDVY